MYFLSWLLQSNEQSVVIGLEQEDDYTYQWTKDGENYSTNAQVEVTEQGIYQLQVSTIDGCEASDSLFIQQVDQEISAEFIASSQVFAGEPFIIVNTANPAPDLIEWEMPSNALVQNQDNEYLEITIDEPGNYQVTAYATSGLCDTYITKYFTVLEREFTDEDTTTTSIKHFVDYSSYPNPVTEGIFNVTVNMDRPARVNLRLFSMQNNTTILRRSGDLLQEYDFEIRLNGTPSGIYFLLLETQGQSHVRKIVVN